MSEYPNLTSYGYQVIGELGRNREGGRITWKAITIQTQKTVVIKQFCFAQANSSWSGYKAYEQEIAVLQKLNHPHIPQYLDSIETVDGFCLIQEYIVATPCNCCRILTVEEVKQIAAKILDLLIYLQQQTPPILHRDLTTNNILLDESLNVYLIDFGFSSLGSREVSASSVFRGTPGFIAPEQIIQPTIASDIYSLGVSLVCLLAHKDIVEVQALTTEDNPYQLKLKKLLPDLDRPFLAWLEKMTKAKVSQRFPNAQSAKDALLKLDLPVMVVQDAPLTSSEIHSTLRPQIIGGVAIAAVTTFTTWGIGLIISQIALSVTMVIIAILAAIAIAITQLGAASIVNSDPQAKSQGIALALIMPASLVSVSGLIWGIEQVVTICGAIAIVEIWLLAYFWRQILGQTLGNIAQGVILLGAIAIGITLGLNLP